MKNSGDAARGLFRARFNAPEMVFRSRGGDDRFEPKAACAAARALNSDFPEISMMSMRLAETEGFEPSIGLYKPITV